MEPKQNMVRVIPPAPKTTRGEPSFIQASPTHLLYFNGCTAVLRCYDNQSAMYITHNCLVTAARFSPDFKYVASVDQKGTLMIHYIEPAKVGHFKTIEHFYAGARCIDWTSDSKRLCAVGTGKNKFGRVISIDTGIDVGEVSAVTANLTTASFRPQRPYKLAVGGQEFTVKFYEGPPYKFTSSKKSHTNFINQLVYSPDGKKIVSVGSDRKITLYDGSTFEVVKQLDQAHSGGIMGVAWIDNDTLVTGGSDKKLKKWNLSLESIAELTSNSNQAQHALIDSFVVAVTYCASNSSVYFVLLSGQIKRTDKDLSKIDEGLEGHKDKPIKVVPIPWEKEKALLLDSHGKILQIDTKSQNVRRFARLFLCNSALLADITLSGAGVVFCLTGDQKVFDFSIHSEKTDDKIQHVGVEGGRFITSIPFTKDNAFICYTREAMRVYWQKDGKYSKVQEVKLCNEPTYVYSSHSETDQQTEVILVGSGKGQMQLFAMRPYGEGVKIEKVTEVQTNKGKITCLYRHGQHIFTGDSMGAIGVWVWKGLELEKVGDMCSHTTIVTSILVKDTNIYTFSMDNKYSVWRRNDFARMVTVGDAHRHGIITAAVIGDCIATCGGDLLVKIHEL